MILDVSPTRRVRLEKTFVDWEAHLDNLFE